MNADEADFGGADRVTLAIAGGDGSRVASPGSFTETVATAPDSGAVQITDCAEVLESDPAEQDQAKVPVVVVATNSCRAPCTKPTDTGVRLAEDGDLPGSVTVIVTGVSPADAE